MQKTEEIKLLLLDINDKKDSTADYDPASMTKINPAPTPITLKIISMIYDSGSDVIAQIYLMDTPKNYFPEPWRFFRWPCTYAKTFFGEIALEQADKRIC